MINAIMPGTIPASLIHLKQNINRYELVENHVAALKYARAALGIKVVNMGPQDFIEGKAFHLILGLLWQLVRVCIFKY
jgi:hypothetical protein